MAQKDKKQLKAIIISNLMVLAVSFLMLVTMSFAWFFSAWSADVPQSMNIKNFAVDLSETTAPSTASELISINAAYPCTFSQAKSNAEWADIYTFSVENIGLVPAQFRLNLQVLSDTGYSAVADPVKKPLSEQIRFAVKIYGATQLEPTAWVECGFLFNSSGVITLDFKQYFNKQLLSVDGAGASVPGGNKYGEIYANADSTTQKNKKVYIKILVWLDHKSTLETIAPITGTVSKLEFYVKMTALQLGGGASFTPEDLGNDATEKVPTPKPVVRVNNVFDTGYVRQIGSVVWNNHTSLAQFATCCPSENHSFRPQKTTPTHTSTPVPGGAV